MDLEVCLYGYFLIVLQMAGAFVDHYFNQKQMRAYGIMTGYSLMQHGGFWCDVFIVTPAVAYLTNKYQFAYTAWYSILTLVAVTLFTLQAGRIYNKVGQAIPVAYSHDGTTPFAGWVHGIFAIAALWIMVMFYLTPIDPAPTKQDLLMMSALFTPFFFLGLYDFSREWVFYPQAKVQFAIEVLALWSVTAIRLSYR